MRICEGLENPSKIKLSVLPTILRSQEIELYTAISYTHQKLPSHFCRVKHFPKALKNQQGVSGCHFGLLLTILAEFKPLTLVLLVSKHSLQQCQWFYFLKNLIVLLALLDSLCSANKGSGLQFTLADHATVEIY